MAISYIKLWHLLLDKGMKLHAALHSCTTMNENGVQ